MRHHLALSGLAISVCSLLLAGCSDEVDSAATAPASVDEQADVAGGSVFQTAFNTEAYDHIEENPFLHVDDQPLSTFAIDVDTASYSNVRRFLTQGQAPPPGAVRIEELINYFSFHDQLPTDGRPFAVTGEVADCPWQPQHRLLRIGLKGKVVDTAERPPSNLVFLLDVSGSMADSNKLPLVQQSLRLLVDQLTERDRVAIVVYAGASGVVLPSTSAAHQERIRSAIDRLHAGGSTNGAEGIELAYQVATSNLIPGGTNRVILCTDGDFNVGLTSRSQMVRMIEQQAQSGTYLSVLGFGMGNLKDSTLEQLADHGNGNYAYIDTYREARKVFVEELSGTLVTIARDVKIQVEFNPLAVQSYRLIGYENRLLANRDFRDDARDAGEIGAGHSVTALYEIVPAVLESEAAHTLGLRYQQTALPTQAAGSGELLTVALRYKSPDSTIDAQNVAEFSLPIHDRGATFDDANDDFRFAAAVAAFGMLLRDSAQSGTATYADVRHWASGALGNDPQGHRAEFLTLVAYASQLESDE